MSNQRSRTIKDNGAKDHETNATIMPQSPQTVMGTGTGKSTKTRKRNINTK